MAGSPSEHTRCPLQSSQQPYWVGFIALILSRGFPAEALLALGAGSLFVVGAVPGIVGGLVAFLVSTLHMPVASLSQLWQTETSPDFGTCALRASVIQSREPLAYSERTEHLVLT